MRKPDTQNEIRTLATWSAGFQREHLKEETGVSVQTGPGQEELGEKHLQNLWDWDSGQSPKLPLLDLKEVQSSGLEVRLKLGCVET